MNNTFLLCYAPKPRSQVTESVLIYQNRSTVNSRLADTSLWRTLAITDKIQIPSKAVAVWLPKWLPPLRTLAITELRTVSRYQCDNFIVLTLDKAYTLYFLLSYLCKITVCRSSFAKTRFKRFPECLFSHRFLKLSAQSSSLLLLRFFSSRLFRRAQALVFHSQRLRLSSVRYCW